MKAENSSGVDTETVELNVLSKPGAPKGPLKVTDVHNEGCKLAWEKPEDDGGRKFSNDACGEKEKFHFSYLSLQCQSRSTKLRRWTQPRDDGSA